MSNTLSLKENKQLIDGIKNDIDLHSSDLVSHGVYGTATGTNTLLMTVGNVATYIEGMLVAFKNTTANTGAVTLNINSLGARSVRKSDGTTLTSGNLKSGGMYQLRYDGVNFILLGEGGGEYGNATASEVLTGKTIGTETGIVTGTMPNNGAITQSLAANGSYTIPEGYHNGSGKVTQSLTNQAAQTITPKTTNQTIPSGRYLTGTQTILGDPNLIAANILSGKSIFGVSGTLVTGKKWASGTAPNFSTETYTVTGLGFTPSVIITKSTYDESGYSYGPHTRVGVYYPAFGINVGYYYYTQWMLLTNMFTANSNGFTAKRLSTGGETRGFTWVAFE